MQKILICDNGSRKPGATLLLRQIAKNLTVSCDHSVDAVSLQHADKIDPTLLDDEPAQTFYEYIRQNLIQGHRSFIVLPLFFGRSRALTSFIPEQQALLEQEFGQFKIAIAEVLYPLPVGEKRLVNILADHILNVLDESTDQTQTAVLVDHGSPVARVSAVRQNLAHEVQQVLGKRVNLEQACMERREGLEYDFNGELLEDWLIRQAQAGVKSAIVSMLFLLPGRHAGAGGDVEAICQRVIQTYPDFNVKLTPLVAEHEGLIDLLCIRLNALLKS